MANIAMSREERREAVAQAVAAMRNGFGGEESFAVDPETGEILIWLNGAGGSEEFPFARLSFTLASATFVSVDEFSREYLGERE